MVRPWFLFDPTGKAASRSEDPEKDERGKKEREDREREREEREKKCKEEEEKEKEREKERRWERGEREREGTGTWARERTGRGTGNGTGTGAGWSLQQQTLQPRIRPPQEPLKRQEEGPGVRERDRRRSRYTTRTTPRHTSLTGGSAKQLLKKLFVVKMENLSGILELLYAVMVFFLYFAFIVVYFCFNLKVFSKIFIENAQCVMFC